MENKFDLVKSYLINLGFAIQHEDADEQLVVITDEEQGINQLVIDCEDPLLIFEQYIGEISNDTTDVYKRLLQINRELVHGAFALDADANRLLFRDTLEVDNLDQNEVKGTLTALSLAMVEFGSELIEFCK